MDRCVKCREWTDYTVSGIPCCAECWEETAEEKVEA